MFVVSVVLVGGIAVVVVVVVVVVGVVVGPGGVVRESRQMVWSVPICPYRCRCWTFGVRVVV